MCSPLPFARPLARPVKKNISGACLPVRYKERSTYELSLTRDGRIREVPAMGLWHFGKMVAYQSCTHMGIRLYMYVRKKKKPL